jgi:heptose I phosphotransferase
LTSVDAVFSFDGGRNLTKKNLAPWRTRTQIEPEQTRTTLFLKRYDKPPVIIQVKNWLWHQRRRSLGSMEHYVAAELAASGINVPKTVSLGEDWGRVFEKRSFIMTEKIASAKSLEQALPQPFENCATEQDVRLCRRFISQLAIFVRQFHQTGYRHQDLYLPHIFWGQNADFYLIDLARAFKPLLFRRRFRIKDLAELYYSTPSKCCSSTDRMRFYLAYVGRTKLQSADKTIIKRVHKKALQMARHNIKHGRNVPFLNGKQGNLTLAK